MSLPPSYWLAQIRADLEARKTTNCRHGISARGTCAECAPETEETEETPDGRM